MCTTICTKLAGVVEGKRVIIKGKAISFFSLNNFITVFEGKMLNYMLSRNGFFVFSQMSNADSQQRVEGVSSYEDARRERGVVPIY